jgi:hypothetical protein
MEFPRFVYKSPGPSRHSTGGAYRFAVVNSQAEIDAHVAAGWSLTPREAIAKAGEPAFLYGLSPVQQKRLKVLKPWLKVRPAEPEPVAEPAPAPAPEPADDAPPTRAEMMQQAELLGIKVDRRWGDGKLLAKINEAMAAPAADDDPI